MFECFAAGIFIGLVFWFGWGLWVSNGIVRAKVPSEADLWEREYESITRGCRYSVASEWPGEFERQRAADAQAEGKVKS